MEHEILPYSCDYPLNLRGRIGAKRICARSVSCLRHSTPLFDFTQRSRAGLMNFAASRLSVRRLWGGVASILLVRNFLLLSGGYFLGGEFRFVLTRGSVHSRCHWSCGKLLRTYAARLLARRSLQMFSPSKILL